MNRRGLTLVEILAATALLAVMAGACVPLLRDAARLTAANQGEIGADSERLAAALGALSDEERHAIVEGILPLNQVHDEVIRVAKVAQTQSGTWLVCTWRSGRVLIWQPAINDEDEP